MKTLQKFNEIAESLLPYIKENREFSVVGGTTTNNYFHIGNLRDFALIWLFIRYVNYHHGYEYKGKINIVFDDLDSLTSNPNMVQNDWTGYSISYITEKIKGLEFNQYYSKCNVKQFFDFFEGLLNESTEVEFHSNTELYSRGLYDVVISYISKNYYEIKDDLVKNTDINNHSDKDFLLLKPILNGKIIQDPTDISFDDEKMYFIANGNQHSVKLFSRELPEVKLPFFIEFKYRQIFLKCVLENSGKDIHNLYNRTKYFMQHHIQKIIDTEQLAPFNELVYEMIVNDLGKKISKRHFKQGEENVLIEFEKCFIKPFILYILTYNWKSCIKLSYDGLINSLQKFIDLTVKKDESIVYYYENYVIPECPPINLRKIGKLFAHISIVDILNQNIDIIDSLKLDKEILENPFALNFIKRFFYFHISELKFDYEEINDTDLYKLQDILELVNSNASDFTIAKHILIQGQTELFYMAVFGTKSGPNIQEFLSLTLRSGVAKSLESAIYSRIVRMKKL